MTSLLELKEQIKVKRRELDKVNIKRSKIYDEKDKLEKELETLEEEHKERLNLKIWKEMLGKYYHVWLFTVSEADKFKKCKYAHVLKVDKGLLEYEYINIDETSKNSDYITISKFDFVHERSYREWTEITKKEYEEVIKSKNPKRLE